LTSRLGACALFGVAAIAAGVGCTKTPPGGNGIAYVAHGDTHGADPSRSDLARISRAEGSVFARTQERCPPNMASVGKFCIDRYEASLVEILPNGDERPFDSFTLAQGHVVRAVSERGVFPHGYVSEVQAKDACARSGKRLCKPDEWRKACMGPSPTTFGYGNTRVSGRCNDHGTSPMLSVMQVRVDRPWTWTYDKMNDPRLNQAPSTLARTGEHASCTNGYGVYDMVGNLHEWVDDPDGTFQGGYYLDTHVNGDGCTYRTTAHGASYHDYSTGFRCCANET
jgi:sulfatase modifying factor 1